MWVYLGMPIPWGVKRKCKSSGVILKMAWAQCEYILPIFPNPITLSLGSRVYRTLMVRAAGHGLVGARGVLGLRPRGSRYALAACATRSRLALRAHDLGFALAVRATRSRLGLCPDNNYMSSLITIKWIHLFCTAKSMNSSAKSMNSSAKSMNSSAKINEFI